MSKKHVHFLVAYVLGGLTFGAVLGFVRRAA